VRPGDFEVISLLLGENFELERSVEAPDWLHAKRALGFELTALQTQLLPLDLEQRAIAQRNDANYGRSAEPWQRS
jgi:hypothetical protein